MRWFLHGKIHKATVTQADLNYVGSITIDENLCEKVGFQEGEKVLIVSNTRGARLETYVICGERDSGMVCMNGAAAHLVKKGDEVIIMGFEPADESPKTKLMLVDENNKFVRYL
jgi:aspartate 1-decarboxylase